MPITLYSASVPLLTKMLGNLAHCLEKAAANAAARKFDPNVLLTARLAPDMLPFTAQIRIACDGAKNGTARLAGVEAPVFADDETTFAQLQARVAKTIDYLQGFTAERIDGRDEAPITFPVSRDGRTRTLAGQAYLTQWMLPNFFFHITTAYALLRHNGVDLGKLDYLEAGVMPA